MAGVEGFLDVLAGDLIAAGYAVCIDGEQDAHAVPGAPAAKTPTGLAVVPNTARWAGETGDTRGRSRAC